MIKKLQRKFVLIAMGSLLAVVLVLVGTINGVNLYQVNSRIDRLLAILTDNGGQFPETPKEGPPRPQDGGPDNPEETDGLGGLGSWGFTPETRFETRYFTAWIDSTGQVIQIDTGHIAAVSSDEAQQYALEAWRSGGSGYYGSYKYQVSQQEDPNSPGSYLVVFVDCGMQLRQAGSFLVISCVVALCSMLVTFLLVSLLSRKAIRPVIKNMEKQRQFITDAGHEIKTPLAVISANTDVLELEGGANEWTQSIRNQVGRLNGLVKNLLALARMEEGAASLAFADFAAGEAVLDAVLPFETVAKTQGKQLKLDIQPELTMRGDEAGIRQLVSILADNAMKYTQPGDTIAISFQPSGKNAVLLCSNPCAGLPDGDLEQLFDRFYRGDASRSREDGQQRGGYGIGLSIARAIVQAHKGKITARLQNGIIHFTAVFPR
ncbi:MAG TPA: HAMP domain-containing histidine kinase [Candidatus Gallacutalibacter stercoravium]|nr:HAMP domain-containing histidine kinase [Candidatus Gallacutalibacter stercoravium]